MFQTINQSHTCLPRILLILIFCVVALLPAAALADGTGPIEPPIQDSDSNSEPAEDGLVDLGVIILLVLTTTT